MVWPERPGNAGVSPASTVGGPRSVARADPRPRLPRAPDALPARGLASTRCKAVPRPVGRMPGAASRALADVGSAFSAAFEAAWHRRCAAGEVRALLDGAKELPRARDHPHRQPPVFPHLAGGRLAPDPAFLAVEGDHEPGRNGPRRDGRAEGPARTRTSSLTSRRGRPMYLTGLPLWMPPERRSAVHRPSRLCPVSATPSAPCRPSEPPPRRPGALATKPGEICGPAPIRIRAACTISVQRSIRETPSRCSAPA